jgi:hypothetical protein
MAYPILFISLAVLQFMAPMLANRVKNRFSEVGVTMKSDPNASWLNITVFWKEAQALNSSVNDPLITKFLWVYKTWWLLLIGSMIALFFGVGLN